MPNLGSETQKEVTKLDDDNDALLLRCPQIASINLVQKALKINPQMVAKKKDKVAL